MPTYTHIPISTNTLSTTAASVTLTIPASTYDDVNIKCTVRTNGAVGAGTLSITFGNGSVINYKNYIATTNASTGTMSGGSTTGTPGVLTNGIPGTTYSNNSFTALDMYLPNYNYTDSFPRALQSFGATNDTTNTTMVAFQSAVQPAASALTTITLTPGTGSFVAGCRFDVFGIKHL